LYVQCSVRVRLTNQRRRRIVLGTGNANVQDVFNEHAMQIISPHYVNNPAAPAIMSKARWFEPATGIP
jgi:hypothetical protein